MNPFRVAKRVLKQRGWCRGARYDRDGRSCLLGAFETHNIPSVRMHLASDDPECRQLKKIIVEKFASRLGADWHNHHSQVSPASSADAVVACFNNNAATTLADVNKVLEIAARRWAAARRSKRGGKQ